MDIIRFGKRLQYYRALHGFTNEQLAVATNISKPHIEQINRGDKVLSVSKLMRISEILGVTYDELLCDSVYADDDMLRDECNELIESLKREYGSETLLSIIKKLKQQMR